MSSRPTERGVGRPAVAQLRSWVPMLAMSGTGVLATWAALWSWAPLLEAPGRFLWPTLAAGAVIVVVGTLCRAARFPLPLVVLAQAVLCLLLLNHEFAAAGGWTAWLPTPDHLSDLFAQARAGSDSMNRYASPIPAGFTGAVTFLALGGTLLVLTVDVCVCGLRRVPLAGLPLLLTVTIPISVLTERLSLLVFLPTAVLFLALLAWQQLIRRRGWGPRAEPAGHTERVAGWLPTTAGVGVLAVLGALVLPGLVPVGSGLSLNGPGGQGDGGGKSEVTVANPIIDLRKDLIVKTHTPLLTARTNAPDPSYLRLAVLDDFTGTQWRPSVRRLPVGNSADGPLPQAPGITAAIPGRLTQWVLQLNRDFRTSWLPTPYPTVQLHVSGDWRYDASTLDIVNVEDNDQSRGLRYSLSAFAPSFTAPVLRAASFAAPEQVQRRMTRLPTDTPPVIGEVAHRVTRGAASEYQELVRLQDWFRSDGGFRYSLAAGSGSGMKLIANFITTDKVGYCEQFAAAMALMGRALGIPSRVVVGFLHPERTGSHTWLYTSDDLHSWPEFYFGGAGWVRFEPTPGVRTGRAPTWTTNRTAPNRSEPLPDLTAPTPAAPSRPAVPVQDADHGSHAGGSGAVAWWPVAVLVLLLGLAMLPALIRLRRRRRRLSADQDPEALVRGAWAELRATAVDCGIGWADRRSPRQALARLRGRVSADPHLVGELEWFTVLVEQARYAVRVEVGPADRARLHRLVRDWTAAIRENAPDRARRWARLFPRTVWERADDPAAPQRVRETVDR